MYQFSFKEKKAFPLYVTKKPMSWSHRGF